MGCNGDINNVIIVKYAQRKCNITTVGFQGFWKAVSY